MAERTTIKAVNRALAEQIGPDVELCRGRGYFYFWGDRMISLPSSSVATMHLSSMTVQEWVDEAKRMLAEDQHGLPAGFFPGSLKIGKAVQA